MKRARGTGTNANGYWMKNGRYLHIDVAEKALRKKLPAGAEVHHVNENKLDNRNENLVICPDGNYHRLLHKRTRAYEACGHADWLKCGHCGKYDAPENLMAFKLGRGNRHARCANEYNQRLKLRRSQLCAEGTSLTRETTCA